MLTMLAKNLATIKYKECIKLMQRQLTSVSQEIIRAVSFQKVYKECYNIFQKKTHHKETPFIK